jgi:hypothetical protein
MASQPTTSPLAPGPSAGSCTRRMASRASGQVWGGGAGPKQPQPAHHQVLTARHHVYVMLCTYDHRQAEEGCAVANKMRDLLHYSCVRLLLRDQHDEFTRPSPCRAGAGTHCSDGGPAHQEVLPAAGQPV